MASQRCPLASASCNGAVAVSQGLALVGSPGTGSIGSVTSLRPLRRLILDPHRQGQPPIAGLDDVGLACPLDADLAHANASPRAGPARLAAIPAPGARCRWRAVAPPGRWATRSPSRPAA